VPFFAKKARRMKRFFIKLDNVISDYNIIIAFVVGVAATIMVYEDVFEYRTRYNEKERLLSQFFSKYYDLQEDIVKTDSLRRSEYERQISLCDSIIHYSYHISHKMIRHDEVSCSFDFSPEYKSLLNISSAWVDEVERRLNLADEENDGLGGGTVGSGPMF